MASGVTVNAECLDRYQELKLGKKAKYIIFKLNPANTEIIVDKISESLDYEEFKEGLPESEPRYAVYDFEYEAEGGGKRNKILFIYWSPDTSKIKPKMVYSASKDSLRKALVGISAEVQANDISDLDKEAVQKKASKGA